MYFLFLAIMGSYAQRAHHINWLLRTLKRNTGNGYLVEQIKQINDSTFNVISMFPEVSGNCAKHKPIELSSGKREWSYIPAVPNQNNGMGVKFNIEGLQKCKYPKQNFDFSNELVYDL